MTMMINFPKNMGLSPRPLSDYDSLALRFYRMTVAKNPNRPYLKDITNRLIRYHGGTGDLDMHFSNGKMLSKCQNDVS